MLPFSNIDSHASILHQCEAHESGDDGVGATDRPGQVGGHQLPDLAGHHAGHHAQHQGLLLHQCLVMIHVVIALCFVITSIKGHLHDTLRSDNETECSNYMNHNETLL